MIFYKLKKINIRLLKNVKGWSIHEIHEDLLNPEFFIVFYSRIILILNL